VRFVVQEFEEVESENSGIQLRSYTFTSFMRRFDGALPSPRTVFEEKLLKKFTFNV
jgi:hypothetical protein